MNNELITSLIEEVTRRALLETGVEVEASGRHVHLDRETVDALFGPGYELTHFRDLSQPGQYVCKERISIVGPKSVIHNVVILGPIRKKTQVEISSTDGTALGIKAPARKWRHSWNTRNFTFIRKKQRSIIRRTYCCKTPYSYDAC